MSARCAQGTQYVQQITKELDKPYLCVGFEDDLLCTKCVIQLTPDILKLTDSKSSALTPHCIV